MDSDDDQFVDHLSPQTLLETPADDIHYSIRSPEGVVTYGVLKVDDEVESVPQIVATGNNFNNAGVQVLTSNINGQFYVISNPSEVITSESRTRYISPRSTGIESNNTAVPTTLNVRKRDERRRATHNEVERRRRDKINNWIAKLSKIIPEGSPTADSMKGAGTHYDGQSKGGILAKACQYITELRENEQKLADCLKENGQLAHTLAAVKEKNRELEVENAALKSLLKKNGIELSTLDYNHCDIQLES